MQAFRRYLRTPVSTPKSAFYLDLGLLPLGAAVDAIQFRYLWKILNSNTRVHEILRNQIQLDTPGSWINQLKRKLNQYGLTTNLTIIQRYSKPRWKKMVARRIQAVSDQKTMSDASSSSKLNQLLGQKHEAKMEEYLTRLSRKRASAIFRLRCKTTRAVDNMSRSTALPICHLCSEDLASDVHIFSACKATLTERTRLDINGIDDVFNPQDWEKIRNIADFCLTYDLVPSY